MPELAEVEHSRRQWDPAGLVELILPGLAVARTAQSAFFRDTDIESLSTKYAAWQETILSPPKPAENRCSSSFQVASCGWGFISA